ncbi:MAG: restriction endonuclease subunit S [Chloroflexi bacterium]|nr:restriction endonuclease subunit S [Chloroflexota bacterium]
MIKQSSEIWDESPSTFSVEFPYIEISAIGIGTNEYRIENIPIAEAPSRAKMIVRADDIILSTTRPHRGAIAQIKKQDDGAIASTGFSILRDLKSNEITREYLLDVLLSPLALKQFLQRSSGGNYPAITPDQLDRVLIPTPSGAIQRALITEMQAAREARRQKLAQADALLAGLDAYLLEQLGITPPQEDKRQVFAVPMGEMRGTSRLNSDYFHPERVLAIRAMQEKKDGLRAERLEDIADFVRDLATVTAEDKYIGLASVQSNTGELVETVEEAEGACLRFVENDVLFARLRPYLNKVHRAEKRGVCSTEFHVIRIRNNGNVLPDYLATILRSSLILVQTRHMMTGNTHPRLTNEDVVNLVVPIPDLRVQQAIATEVKRRRERSGRSSQ